MSRINFPVMTRTWTRDTLLIARKFDEPTEFFLWEAFQGIPEVFYMGVSLYQAYLIHGVCLCMENWNKFGKYYLLIWFVYILCNLKLTVMSTDL